MINLADYYSPCDLIVWEEVNDKNILKIFEEECKKLHLENTKICLTRAESEKEKYLSPKDMCCGRTIRWCAQEYEVRLYPEGLRDHKNLLSVIRHELYHIRAGHLEHLSSLPWWLRRIFDPLFRLFDEVMAEAYEKGDQ